MKRVYCYWLFCLLSFSFSSSSQANVQETINQLAERCRESESDSVIISHNGRTLFEYSSGKTWEPIDTLTLTQSIASLAIGILIDEGFLELDEPVHHFYPEWNQGRKREITIRHLLTNTSGLQGDSSNFELYRSKDILQIALCSELSRSPGQAIYCNNKAVNLLSGIVKKASGINIGQFLQLKLFAPLDIRNASWLCDGVGENYFHSHLTLTAPDLIKIGEMIARDGFYQGRPIVSKRWIDLMTSPGHHSDPFFGMLWQLNFFNVQCWWDEDLLLQYQHAGIDPIYINRLRTLEGRTMPITTFASKTGGHHYFNTELIDLFGGVEDIDLFSKQVNEYFLPIAKWKVGSLYSFASIGTSGQQLIIFPEKKIVAVRLIRPSWKSRDPFYDFEALIEKLIYHTER